MLTKFHLEAPRQIEAADYCCFRVPALHPDRTMNGIHDFIYMTEGEWEIGQDSETFTLKKDKVLILTAGLHHYPIRPCSVNARTIFIHMFSASGDSLVPDSQRQQPGVLPPVIDCAGNPRIKKTFEDIVYFYGSRGATGSIIISSMCRLLLCHLSDLVQLAPDSDQAVFRAVRIIKQNPSVFLSGSQLADLSDVSERTLRKKFLANFGKTIRKYQLDEKLAAIQSMLISHPGISLRELADNFGFCDEFYLSRCFKEKYGISPGNYRRENRS